MARDPLKYFRIEGRELIDQLGKGLLDLERSPRDAELIGKLFRLAHTLKGAARVVKQREMAERAHAMEDALAPLRDGSAAASRERIDGMLAQRDGLLALLTSLALPTESESAPQPKQEEASLHGGADPEELDLLLGGVAQLRGHVVAMTRKLAALERARRMAELLDEQLASPQSAGAPLAALQKARSMAGELRGLVDGLEGTLSDGVDRLERELSDVRESAERIRLVGASSIFNALERTARDAAHSLGRKVTFETAGGNVRLDARVLGLVQSAFVQAVRNAVAHGIEPEKERLAAGKPAAGLVRLEVRRQREKVAFLCTDDGCGVDLEAVRKAAKQKGLSRSADSLDVEGILGLLLSGGITTSDSVTPISGRGVGLDIVRDAARQLGGTAAVRTEKGTGTSIELIVPVSLLSLEALVMQAGDQVVAIPIEAVRQTIRLSPGTLCKSPSGFSLTTDEGVVPFVTLEQLLRSRTSAPVESRTWAVVVIRAGDRAAALGVDRLLGVENALLRALPPLTPADPIAGGISLDLDGTPRIVLDAAAVVERARAAPLVPAPVASSPPAVLIVDDSLTTRMLEQSILESAGYSVDLATCGEEGLVRARERAYSLFLVDVEMPGMDGFTFIERTRADSTLRHIPAILVTSRAADEDRQRGREAGARGYVVKSEFDQVGLLETIRMLVGNE